MLIPLIQFVQVAFWSEMYYLCNFLRTVSIDSANGIQLTNLHVRDHL